MFGLPFDVGLVHCTTLARRHVDHAVVHDNWCGDIANVEAIRAGDHVDQGEGWQRRRRGARPPVAGLQVTRTAVHAGYLAGVVWAGCAGVRRRRRLFVASDHAGRPRHQ